MPSEMKYRRSCRALVLAIALVALGSVGSSLAQPAPPAPDPLTQVADLLQRAKKLGAHRDLPGGFRNVEKRLEEARSAPLSAEDTETLLLDARRLANRAAFISSLSDARSPLEAMANRFDLTMQEVASLEDLQLDPGLSGVEAAARLLDQLMQARQERQTDNDSLRVKLASLQELTGGRVAAQDSLITSLRVEISDLRRRLWEMELRAGVAEADRSAAESALTRRQDKEAAVKEIGADLGEANGTVVFTPAGEVVLQLHGLQFGVGSAQLKAGQAALLDKVAAAIKRFPGATVRVEGNTDDTGSRAVNLELSQNRAAAVAGALAQRLQVAAETITTLGNGPDRPVASNATDEGRARNRRIDVVITPVP